MRKATNRDRPSKYVEYQLQGGFVGNWLVAGPQAFPVDLGKFAGEDFERRIIDYHREEESGIRRTPVERGPLEKGLFRIGAYRGSWSYYPCPEDHFVDQSGYHASCRYLRSWAYVDLVSEAPQEVALALTTYGPSDVWVDHEHVFRAEHAAKGPVTAAFPARLRKGATALLVRFEGVGLRQTPHAFALRVCRPGADPREGLAPAEGVHARFTTLIPHVGRRNAFETLSAAAYVDRDVYEGETPIVLRWPEGPRGLCPSHVRLQSSDDSIYAYGDVAGAPGDELQLGYPVQLPAGPLRVTLMPSPDEVYREHIRIFHDVPLWSLGRQRYRVTPEGTLEERRIEALRAAASVDGSPFAQMARMALGAWADVDAPALLEAVEGVKRREDGSSLALLGLLGMAYRWGDHPDFPEALRQPLEGAILGFRYWVGDPGRDAMDFESESNRLVFHACEVLAGQRHPDSVFADGRSGDWHRARGERLAREWLSVFGAYGSTEWHAPTAIEQTIAALSHLTDLGADEETHELAAICLDKLLFSLALNSSRGILGAASQAGRADAPKSGLLQPTSGISRLLWGVGIFNHYLAGVVSLACAPGYEMPPLVERIAHDAPAELWSHEQHAPPGAPAANLVTYKTPDYILASVQDYRPGQPGRQELVWRATLGAEAVVFASHPGSSSESDGRCPGFWAGNGRLPRVAQWRDVLVAVHRLPDDDVFGFTHAYFPTAAFDEHALRDGWAFARLGNGYLALTNSRGFTLSTEGRYARRELRAHGAEQAWLVQMGRAELDGDFAAFQDKALARSADLAGGDVRYQTLRGDRLEFGWEGPFVVNGEAQPLGGFAHVENAYTTTELPCEAMEFRLGEYGLRLDFSQR